MKTVLFDLDGTLIDSAPSICAGLAAALRTLDRPVPDESELRACIGLPLVHVWRRLGLTPEQDAAAVAGYRAWAVGADRTPPSPFPGVPELLHDLHAAGICLILASAKDTASARRAVVQQGWEALFHAVSGAEPGDAADKRALVGRALAMLPVGAAAVMVGDMPVDGDAAQAHGLPFIACPWGNATAEALVACKPAAMPGDIAGLRAILLPHAPPPVDR